MTHSPSRPDVALSDIDLTDPQTFLDSDLAALWRRFRRESPVHWHQEREGAAGFWVLSRYEDVVATYRDNSRFTSEYGNVLATLLRGGDSAAGKMLAVTDGEQHRKMRQAMLRSFSPRTMRNVVLSIRKRTSALVEQVTSSSDFDFAAAVAERIPMGTICDLMAVPEGDREQLLDWNKRALSADSADTGEVDAIVARNEILLYFAELARYRREHPGADVISDLTEGSAGCEPLSDEEIVFNCYSLLIGGDESSRMSAIVAVLALIENPDQWRALKNGDVPVGTAVEEVLRWTTPAMHFGRRATTEVPMGEAVLRAGDIVTLWNTSANHDDEVFADPGSFLLARTPNRHVAFGHGAHFCIGAYLGRAELHVLLETLRELVTEMELTGTPERVYSNFLFGYSSLPVRFG